MAVDERQASRGADPQHLPPGKLTDPGGGQSKLIRTFAYTAPLSTKPNHISTHRLSNSQHKQSSSVSHRSHLIVKLALRQVKIGPSIGAGVISGIDPFNRSVSPVVVSTQQPRP